MLALDSTAYKGVNYNFPGTVQIQGVMFYNKTQWAEAGLTEADIPTTWAETEQVCATLQAAGLTPMITGGEWVTGYALSSFQAAHVVELVTDRWAGEVSFTDDEWVEATAFFKRLVDNGYFNKGALSTGYANLEQQFLAGNATIYPMGSGSPRGHRRSLRGRRIPGAQQERQAAPAAEPGVRRLGDLCGVRAPGNCLRTGQVLSLRPEVGR